uniref:Uncharacterized protein n=2 Tax=Anguilla anguilla TaxID=7936 RepID=A0A0E9XTR3_ANGAN
MCVCVYVSVMIMILNKLQYPEFWEQTQKPPAHCDVTIQFELSLQRNWFSRT